MSPGGQEYIQLFQDRQSLLLHLGKMQGTVRGKWKTYFEIIKAAKAFDAELCQKGGPRVVHGFSWRRHPKTEVHYDTFSEAVECLPVPIVDPATNKWQWEPVVKGYLKALDDAKTGENDGVRKLDAVSIEKVVSVDRASKTLHVRRQLVYKIHSRRTIPKILFLVVKTRADQKIQFHFKTKLKLPDSKKQKQFGAMRARFLETTTENDNRLEKVNGDNECDQWETDHRSHVCCDFNFGEYNPDNVSVKEGDSVAFSKQSWNCSRTSCDPEHCIHLDFEGCAPCKIPGNLRFGDRKSMASDFRKEKEFENFKVVYDDEESWDAADYDCVNIDHFGTEPVETDQRLEDLTIGQGRYGTGIGLKCYGLDQDDYPFVVQDGTFHLLSPHEWQDDLEAIPETIAVITSDNETIQWDDERWDELLPIMMEEFGFPDMTTP